MKSRIKTMRYCAWVLAPLSLLLLAGCDEGGVLDIVAGSLQLAFGIVEAAS